VAAAVAVVVAAVAVVADRSDLAPASPDVIAGSLVMEPIKQLADAIFWERIEKARRMSAEDKFLGGARLFDRSCRIMADGIRAEFPEADDRRVQEILCERLALTQRLQERRRPGSGQR
jgi:hypothetical protein